MADTYTYIHDLRGHTQVRKTGILSQAGTERRTLPRWSSSDSPRARSCPRTPAPYPAILTFLKGEASLRLGNRREGTRPRALRLHAGLSGARHQGEDRRRRAG